MRAALPQVEAEIDLVVEDVETGFCGAVVRVEKMALGVVVELEDRHGRRRSFPLGPGFHLDGRPVELVRPATAPVVPAGAARTASGFAAVPDAPAKVAAASRIYVEGRHDAELVERVWGDDLRVEGIVVEYLGGIDDLAGVVAEFRPGPGRRLGVLVDHLVPGSKEDADRGCGHGVPRERARPRRRPSLRRRVAERAAGSPRHRRPGRSSRPDSRGRKA